MTLTGDSRTMSVGPSLPTALRCSAERGTAGAVGWGLLPTASTERTVGEAQQYTQGGYRAKARCSSFLECICWSQLRTALGRNPKLMVAFLIVRPVLAPTQGRVQAVPTAGPAGTLPQIQQTTFLV